MCHCFPPPAVVPYTYRKTVTIACYQQQKIDPLTFAWMKQNPCHDLFYEVHIVELQLNIIPSNDKIIMFKSCTQLEVNSLKTCSRSPSPLLLPLLLLLPQLKSLSPSFNLSCSLWTTNLDSLSSLYCASGWDTHACTHTLTDRQIYKPTHSGIHCTDIHMYLTMVK